MQIYFAALKPGMDLDIRVIIVTVHEKTMHNALKKIFELRPPLPTTTFELLLEQI